MTGPTLRAFNGNEPQPSIVSVPMAVTVEMGTAKLFDTGQELILLVLGHTVKEAAAKHVHPIAESGLWMVKLGESVE